MLASIDLYSPILMNETRYGTVHTAQNSSVNCFAVYALHIVLDLITFNNHSVCEMALGADAAAALGNAIYTIR